MATKGILAVIAAVVLSATGCTGSASRPAAPSHGVPATIATTVSTAVARPGPQGCPVTLPSRSGASSIPKESLFGWESSYGDGRLAVGGLWPNGVIKAGPDLVEKDGSVRMKFGWWRGIPGKLDITGRRLDGSAPYLRADIPDGYGKTGFQATGLYFPTEGCWEVTGRVDTTHLTFVTYVIKTATSAD
jgi:hypothetical protein